MLALLVSATQVVTVSCGDINTLVDRAKVYPDLSDKDRQEVIDLYYEFGEAHGLYCKDANDWRNGSSKHPITKNQMAQVTYRGVKYDTNNKKAQQAKEVELTYRGIAHAK